MGRPRIAIVGASLGGIVAAALLQRSGMETVIYERARSLSRYMGGVHLSPNAMKVLRRICCESELCGIGAHPDFWVSRDAESGEPIAQIALGDYVKSTYGAAYLTVPRSDLVDVIEKSLTPASIRFGKCLRCVEDTDSGVRMTFTDETVETADLLVVADGAGSAVRTHLLGVAAPYYSGYVTHRLAFPASLLGHRPYDMCAKWWSRDRQLLGYYLTSTRNEYYFVTTVPQQIWPDGMLTISTTRNEMREAFADFHPDVRRLMDISPSLSTRPLLHQNSSPIWSSGRSVLIGDACHPMRSTAQGAAIAIEDAAMLARCLNEAGAMHHRSAFALYEANRVDRIATAQRLSATNAWMRDDVDLSWFQSYDAFETPLRLPSAREIIGTVDDWRGDFVGNSSHRWKRQPMGPIGATGGFEAQTYSRETQASRALTGTISDV
jgi:6-hydroxynicotinate 3-monooxygenase